MTEEVSELLKKALTLPPEGRAALAGSLLDSLDETVDASDEAAWSEEIAHRIEELDSGKVKPIPWPKPGGKSRPSSMAARTLEIHPSALAEFKSALTWYLERNATAAGKFAAEVDHAVALAVERRHDGRGVSTAQGKSS